MARDYIKKLEAMRAYAQTPAGKASKKRSQARWIAKRKESAMPPRNELIAQPQSLIAALQNWR